MFTIATSSTGTGLVRRWLRATERIGVLMAALRALTAHTVSVFAIQVKTKFQLTRHKIKGGGSLGYTICK